MSHFVKKVLLAIFVYYILNTIYVIPVSAAAEFSTQFNSTYSVSQEGIASVTHDVELTNKLKNIYAQEYQLNIGSTRIKDVIVSSNAGTVTANVNTSQNSTDIKLNFEKPIVGIDKTLRFKITYLNLDIAQKNGRVLEVNVPRISGADDLDNYNVSIKVPASFDSPTIITPPTSNITANSSQQILNFTKKDLTTRGISILFGNHQNYNFTLRYTLKNPGITKGITQVAIPSDTPYQTLIYSDISPQPENVTIDPDGNWLAHYTLNPGQTIQISANGQATLFLKPQTPSQKPADLSQYLVSQKYWPVDNPAVIELAQKLKTPENIYNYIVNNLNYNYDRIDSSSTQRLGGLAALQDPQNAICTEFTDLFVSLTRAAGIPARGVSGFAFTTNSKLRPLSFFVRLCLELPLTSKVNSVPFRSTVMVPPDMTPREIIIEAIGLRILF